MVLGRVRVRPALVIAVGLLRAGPDGAARLQPLAADLRTAVDEAIAAAGPDGAVALHDPASSAGDADTLTQALAVLRQTGCGAVVAAAPQTDTLKLATPSGSIERTIERSLACEIRTPQVYRAGALRAALTRTGSDVVEQAIREHDHAFLPGLVDGVVRVLPLQPAAADAAASSSSARTRSAG